MIEYEEYTRLLFKYTERYPCRKADLESATPFGLINALDRDPEKIIRLAAETLGAGFLPYQVYEMFALGKR